MLVVATVLSRQFVKPINKSLAAVRGGAEMVASGIPEIDELLAAIRERPTERCRRMWRQGCEALQSGPVR